MKNLQTLLEKLGIETENIEALSTALTTDADATEQIDAVLSKAQAYARPFIEAEVKDALGAERKTWKGKYFKEAAGIANKIFGNGSNVLTSSEIDKIIADAKEDGKTFDSVILAIREKISQRTGTPEAELQQMLDAANAKIQELSEAIPAKEAEFNTRLNDEISKYKLNSVLDARLVDELSKITTLPASKAAQLLKSRLTERAILKLNDAGEIELYDPKTPETRLKKNPTTLHTFSDLVKDTATEYELPAIKSGGAKKVQDTPAGGEGQQQKQQPKSAESANGLAAVMDALGG